MVRGGATVHHIHKRKRFHISHKLEPYPHPNKAIRWLDKLILALSVLGPMSILPQIFDVFSTRNVQGLSLATWGILVVICIPWVAYGFIHKEKPIIIANIFWFVLQLFVVIGILMYA